MHDRGITSHMTLSLGLFTTALLATGLMRLGEVAVSARRMRQRPEAVLAEPALFPAMALLHVGLIVLPLAEVFVLERPFSWLTAGPALGLLVGATALRVWTLKTIGISWNVRVVRPEPDRIATTGPYRWIRHPNYLVVILEILALPMLHGAWLAAALLTVANAAVLARRIRNEERVLATVPAWEETMAQRSRLIPGIF